ncbi:hypothetical protein PPERSA_09818 [Pseudocohnilembus persalinus]|uniref:Uncharacterized protein n=1 Tax=Pseudocohnilembus persalinus TaxID=266149 RepID=A0A0V0QTU3_PSEPJ|nr:hypothetical protein PPERSA_09818 [Pseudocohnilembus persalinus]|eukprot:KRX05678.1 hypothetical protein PPERSA_09818 [Pseudocohnilembus persalinus]
MQIFNQNCDIIQKEFQFGGKQSYICDFLKQILTDLISLNEKNKQLLQLNVDDKIQCSQIWDKLNITMKDDISLKYQNYIINNINQLFDLRDNEILNKPQLPNQVKCQQRQQKLLTTQKNQSKFYNLNKILISRMIRYLGTENLGKMIIPGQLKKKMQNILYLVKNCSKTNFGNKKNKKQDYYNHAHYNLLFLSLNQNSIQKMLEKDEKNAIYHKKVYKLDLQKVLEVLQKDGLENEILQQRDDNDQLQNIQDKKSIQPSILLNKLGYQDFQSQSQNIINFNFSKFQIESGCYQYFQDKINNIDNNKKSKPNHLQQQLQQLLLAQKPQNGQILKDNYIKNLNNSYNIQNNQLNYLNKLYDCETQASHDSNNYQQNNSRNNFSSYDSSENQGLIKKVKKEEVNEYKNNENTVPILSQDSNNMNENQINLQNNCFNFQKNSQELQSQKLQDDKQYQHIIDQIQEINFIKTCFYYAIVKNSQADFLGTNPIQYENKEYEFRAFSALQLMVQGEFIRRF